MRQAAHVFAGDIAAHLNGERFTRQRTELRAQGNQVASTGECVAIGIEQPKAHAQMCRQGSVRFDEQRARHFDARHPC